MPMICAVGGMKQQTWTSNVPSQSEGVSKPSGTECQMLKKWMIFRCLKPDKSLAVTHSV